MPTGLALVPIASVHVGTILIADNGFTCLRNHQRCEVKQREDGLLYIDCASGTHTLDGQEELTPDDVEPINYVGFWLEPSQ